MRGSFPRGGESVFSLVLVAGRRVNGSGGGSASGHRRAGDTGGIEVPTSPQSALCGAAGIGGVSKIVARRGGAPGLHFYTLNQAGLTSTIWQRLGL